MRGEVVALKGCCPNCGEEVYAFLEAKQQKPRHKSECHVCEHPLVFHATVEVGGLLSLCMLDLYCFSTSRIKAFPGYLSAILLPYSGVHLDSKGKLADCNCQPAYGAAFAPLGRGAWIFVHSSSPLEWEKSAAGSVSRSGSHRQDAVLAVGVAS
jgi:hypothetical protein